MSSYYPSFNYMGVNSLKDKNLIVTHFDSGDDGEVDTFLSMEPIFTESSLGTHRIDYGARYNEVAVIRITVMKSTASDFTVDEVRDFLRWTTGARQNSYLDLVENQEIKYSFLGRVTNVFQQKLDARTIGFVLEFTSVSPWAYSAIQEVMFSMGQALTIDENGVLSKDEQSLGSVENGILKNGSSGFFNVENDGTVYVDSSTIKTIINDSDDLYSYVYLDTVFNNKTCDELVIDNITLGEKTKIARISNNESITLSSEQFIMSDKTGRIFGDDFNFVWPRLKPGANTISISGTGDGEIIFTYRYPIKIGDCAINTDVSGGNVICGDNSSNNSGNTGNGSNTGGSVIAGTLAWENITNKPTTRDGYNLSDVYTMSEVNYKIDSAELSIDETELAKMLENTLGE